MKMHLRIRVGRTACQQSGMMGVLGVSEEEFRLLFKSAPHKCCMKCVKKIRLLS